MVLAMHPHICVQATCLKIYGVKDICTLKTYDFSTTEELTRIGYFVSVLIYKRSYVHWLPSVNKLLQNQNLFHGIF